MNEPETVVIVDDDEAVRSALKLLLQTVGLTTRSFASATDFLAKWDLRAPGCLVLDVRMPGMSGLELQEQLNLRGAVLPVIFITGHGDVPMAVEAMQRGAFDFLQKPFRDQDMLDAVTVALEADRRRRAEESGLNELKTRFADLTAREKQVMTLVTTGLMNKQVAGMLSLSEVTVKIHRGSVMRKMGARTLADLIRMAELLHLNSLELS